jgi:hypothetical protein
MNTELTKAHVPLNNEAPDFFLKRTVRQRCYTPTVESYYSSSRAEGDMNTTCNAHPWPAQGAGTRYPKHRSNLPRKRRFSGVWARDYYSEMRRVVESQGQCLICNCSERSVRLFTEREHTADSSKVLHPMVGLLWFHGTARMQPPTCHSPPADVWRMRGRRWSSPPHGAFEARGGARV